MGESLTLRGTLQEHRSVRESWGVARFLVLEVDGDSAACPSSFAPGNEADVVGDRIGLASAGERLELRGEVDDHPRFGLRFKVTEQRSQGIQSPHEASRWLERLDGVGPVKARALVSRFGADLVDILRGDKPGDLSEVHGVSEAAAKHILESFHALELSGDLESVRYLDGIGCSRWEANKVLEFCARQRPPVKPRQVLEGRPYSLTDQKGLGFAKVDKLARAAGCSPHAPARVEAGVMHQLDEIVQGGSTMVILGRLAREAGEKVLNLPQEAVVDGVTRLAASGKVVLAADERGKTWVHPAWLLRCEREIYRAASWKPMPKRAPQIAPSGRPLEQAPPAAEEEPQTEEPQGVPLHLVCPDCAAGMDPARCGRCNPLSLENPAGQAGPEASAEGEPRGEGEGAVSVNPIDPEGMAQANPVGVGAVAESKSVTQHVNATPAGGPDSESREERVGALLGLLDDDSTEEDW